MSFARYFLNLGFYPDITELGPELPARRALWTLTAYFLLSSGVFCRQCIALTPPPARFAVASIQPSVLTAALVIGLSLLPPLMQWFNKKRRKPGWEHILWAFSFGFFVDLSAKVIWKYFF